MTPALLGVTRANGDHHPFAEVIAGWGGPWGLSAGPVPLRIAG